MVEFILHHFSIGVDEFHILDDNADNVDESNLFREKLASFSFVNVKSEAKNSHMNQVFVC